MGAIMRRNGIPVPLMAVGRVQSGHMVSTYMWPHPSRRRQRKSRHGSHEMGYVTRRTAHGLSNAPTRDSHTHLVAEMQRSTGSVWQ